MGSIINLHPINRKPFMRGLLDLRRQLNRRVVFDGLATRGILEISPVANIMLHRRHHITFDDHPYFMAWAAESGFAVDELFELNDRERFDMRTHMFSCFKPPADRYEQESCARVLDWLRIYLGDDKNVLELAAVGPCLLSLNWDDKGSLKHTGASVLVNNYLPTAIPNADSSVSEYPEGDVHRPSGLWLHS